MAVSLPGEGRAAAGGTAAAARRIACGCETGMTGTDGARRFVAAALTRWRDRPGGRARCRALLAAGLAPGAGGLGAAFAA
jgi:hypothetical protein